MKKIIFLLLVLSLSTGCSNQELLTCTNDVITENDVAMNAEYKIYYKGKYVTLVKSTEKIVTDDKTLLETYKDNLEESYSPYNKLDYYANSISIEDNTLISSTTINYEKIDIDKLKKLDKDNNLIKKGKIKLDDLQTLYEDNGAICN